MKKLLSIFNIILVVVFINIICLTGCTTNEDNKISLIVSNTYGSIRPIDIYEIKGGSILFTKSDKDIILGKEYSFCAIDSSKTKKDFISSTHYVYGLKVDNKYKIGVWDVKNARPAIGYPVTEKYRLLYSEYYGEKEFVSAKTDVSFFKTLPINIEEKDDTYIIKYYRKPGYSSLSNPICFNDYKTTINEYKIEVLKSDILKIEYFT